MQAQARSLSWSWRACTVGVGGDRYASKSPMRFLNLVLYSFDCVIGVLICVSGGLGVYF